jgi:ribonuclease Z
MEQHMSAGIRFVLLGSGAVRNNPRRGGPGQIVHVGDHVLMFDCGRSACTGLARAGVQAEDVDRLFLTHLHFDHVTDVPCFVFVGWNNGRDSRLRVHGPVGTDQFVRRIIRPPFEQDIASRVAHGKDASLLDPHVTDIDAEGPVVEERGYEVSAIFTEHAGMPSLAYRVDIGDRRVVITGDGPPSPALTAFCQGADLLVSECSGTAEFLAEQPWGAWHTNPETLAAMASEANVSRVVIKHLVMEDITGDPLAAERMADDIRRGYGGDVLVGEDGMVVPVT